MNFVVRSHPIPSVTSPKFLGVVTSMTQKQKEDEKCDEKVNDENKHIEKMNYKINKHSGKDDDKVNEKE